MMSTRFSRCQLQAVFVGVGAIAASHPAQSQTSIVMYGLIDAAVEHVSNVGPAKAGLTRMPSLTASQPSRWGVRGSEDLGGGLKAIFTLEAGFAPDDGSTGQGGRGFGRQSFVGVSGPWGTFTLGRQYTMLFWSLLDSDYAGPHAYGLAALDPYVPNARADNAFSYKGTFGKFTLGATYSLGRDTVNAGPSPAGTNCPGESAVDRRACREYSLLAKYDDAEWGVALAHDVIRGGAGAFAGLTSSGLTDTRSIVNGYVKLGQLRIGAGTLWRQNEGSRTTPNSRINYLGIAYTWTPNILLEAEIRRLSFQNSANSALILSSRVTYFLSRRTAMYGMIGNISNDGLSALSVSAGAPGSNPLPGGSQTGFMVGVRHAF